jgi:uncharacterized membrane protein
MPYLYNRKSDLLERFISALCYPSCGLIGLIYLLISGKHARTAPFFYFHFLQSIILGILTFLLGWTGSIIKQILMGIAGLIFALLPISTSVAMGIGSVIDWSLLLINGVIYILMIYGFLFSLLGKEAEIPGVSAMVRKNM